MAIMTAAQWVERMEHCANQHPNAYKNSYPYNLLYFDGTTLSADCVNLQKALFNGYDIARSHEKGYYQRDLSKTGDCTEYGLLKQCSEISSDFTKLDDRPRILYKSGHIGAYLGKEVAFGGKVDHCIEATVAFGGGIVYAYVDRSGRRFNVKGGAQNSAWTKHGLPTPWVSFPKVDPKKELVMKWQTAEQKDGLYPSYCAIDGDFGIYSEAAAKTYIRWKSRFTNTVVFWQTWLRDKGYYKGYIDGDFGEMTHNAVLTAQAAYNLYQDACIGLKSTRAFLEV